MSVSGLRGGRRGKWIGRVECVFFLLLFLLWVKIEGVHGLGWGGVIRFIIFIERVLLLPFKDYSICYKTPRISGKKSQGTREPKNIYFCVMWVLNITNMGECLESSKNMDSGFSGRNWGGETSRWGVVINLAESRRRVRKAHFKK